MCTRTLLNTRADCLALLSLVFWPHFRCMENTKWLLPFARCQVKQPSHLTRFTEKRFDLATGLVHALARRRQAEGHATVLAFLLGLQGSESHLSAADRWGGTPLDDALTHRHTECEKLLRAAGVSPAHMRADELCAVRTGGNIGLCLPQYKQVCVRVRVCNDTMPSVACLRASRRGNRQATKGSRRFREQQRQQECYKGQGCRGCDGTASCCCKRRPRTDHPDGV